MGYYEQQYRKRLSLAHANSALITLVAINLIVFVILAFMQAIFYLRFQGGQAAVAEFNNGILDLFALPAETSALISRPWTIITHMFVQIGVWHVLGNMLWLWFFGYILQDLTGNRKLVPIYLYGGLTGALAYLLSYNLFPGLEAALPFATLIGASGAVMAIAVAVTTIAPGYRVLPMLNGGIPIWIITAIYLLIDVATIPVDNAGGHIAHLGGAIAGFLFVFAHRRGIDLGKWMNNLWDWFTNLFNPDKPKKGKDIKQQLFYKSPAKPYSRTPNITSQRIDEILDKINTDGYQSLSNEEKELLKRASKEDI